MPLSGRRLAPRRRRADDGEEEGSIVGDLDEGSLSEGSAISLGEEDGDAEASDASLEDERETAPGSRPRAPAAQSTKTAVAGNSPPDITASDKSAPTFSSSAKNDAMLNGLKAPTAVDGVEELHFDVANADGGQLEAESARPTDPQTNAPKAPRNETPAQRSRREHQEYLRQRNSNPTFVPNRGGFFLHDDRSSTVASFNVRPAPRGRGRGFDQGFHGPRLPLSEPTAQQWAHDLHDKHENAQQAPAGKLVPNSDVSQPQPAPAAPTSTAPNRSFSFSTVLGNVTVFVSLPGMSEKKSISNVVKKHHTLLPQHRPPLRRDKPVRISIPDEHPRYIFPSTERSFIFIPRALRPNQQSYFRGRGRGNFPGSRRTSVFGGSTYTPSVAMSRKSSFGGVARDTLRSPAGSTASRPMLMGIDGPKPIVRLPSANMMPNSMLMPDLPGTVPMSDHTALANGSMVYGFHSTAIPMHHPRPQKAVSVADIESPASLSVRAPQQQQEQPFHQQFPAYVGSGDEQHGPHQPYGHVNAPGSTPLSHIPESAVYAQAFQPFPFMQPQMMYGAPYGNPTAFFHPMAGGMQFGAPVPGMAMAPAFATPPMHSGPQSHSRIDHAQHPNTMAHESNGMVYYYDPLQYVGQSQQEQFGMGTPGMHMTPMMNPQAPYYYPQGPNGVYYPAQSA